MKLLLWGVVVGVVSGCDAPPETKQPGSEPSASAATSVASVATPDPAPPPAVSNSVTFASRRIGMDGFTLVHTEATQHKMSTGAKAYTAIIVHLANYARGGGNYLPEASKEGQRKVTLNFASPGAPAVGTYPVDGALGESNKLSVGIHDRDYHVGLIKGTGTGEITSIDGGKVSGKVTVKDDQGTTLEATFNVPYETK